MTIGPLTRIEEILEKIKEENPEKVKKMSVIQK